MGREARFDSADIDKTPTAFVVELPERLIHENVEGSARDTYVAERKHPVYIVDLPSRAISMVIGCLEPGERTNRHRHTYETVLYVLEGRGYSTIETRRVAWQAGDAVYIPVWAWHQHVNLDDSSPVRYLSCGNAAMLQNIGNLAIREEAT